MRLPQSGRQLIPLAVALVVADILVMFALHRDEHHLRFRAMLIATLVLAFFGSVALVLRFLFHRGRRAGRIGVAVFVAFMVSLGGLAAYAYWDGKRDIGPFQGHRPTTLEEFEPKPTSLCSRSPRPH